MFTKGQKVWCALFGAGVVTEIRHASEGPFPVEVGFNNGRNSIYTNEGKYYVDSNVTLFPYPVEIVKAVTKPSIDWSHVSPEYNYLIQDSDGDGYLCGKEPSRAKSWWFAASPNISASAFTSYVPGACDWKDSLVERPN